MAKDPAFLFYPGDWLGGTLTFTRPHKGAYMDLLMAQFNQGRLSIDDVQHVLGADFVTMWESKLKAKFIQDNKGLFYNEKLDNESIKRKNFTASRGKNLKSNQSHTGTHMQPHMENVNVNKDIDTSNTIYPAFVKFLIWRKAELKKPIKTDRGQMRCFKRLILLSAANPELAEHIIAQSMDREWVDIFELKEDYIKKTPSAQKKFSIQTGVHQSN